MASEEKHAPAISIAVALDSTNASNSTTSQGSLFSTSSGARSGIHTCLQCQKHFTESRSLARHLRDSCKNSDLPRERYHCEWCGLSFSRNDILQRHVQEVHLLQGNQKRMSKIRQQASCVLYGEPLEPYPKGDTHRDVVGATFLSTEKRRISNFEFMHSRDDIDPQFNDPASASCNTLDGMTGAKHVPVGIASQAAIASDAVDTSLVWHDHQADRIAQEKGTNGFDIKDWVDAYFLGEHSERSEG